MMTSFEITPSADADIEEIIRYTIEKWDVDQAIQYAAQLDNHFEKIGENRVRSKVVFEHRDDLHMTKCQKHIIFYQSRPRKSLLIVAVFHESMDLMIRLEERLSE